eukprot:1149306-Pelagomonas_calceolata.AAC.6
MFQVPLAQGIPPKHCHRLEMRPKFKVATSSEAEIQCQEVWIALQKLLMDVEGSQFSMELERGQIQCPERTDVWSCLQKLPVACGMKLMSSSNKLRLKFRVWNARWSCFLTRMLAYSAFITTLEFSTQYSWQAQSRQQNETPDLQRGASIPDDHAASQQHVHSVGQAGVVDERELWPDANQRMGPSSPAHMEMSTTQTRCEHESESERGIGSLYPVHNSVFFCSPVNPLPHRKPLHSALYPLHNVASGSCTLCTKNLCPVRESGSEESKGLVSLAFEQHSSKPCSRYSSVIVSIPVLASIEQETTVMAKPVATRLEMREAEVMGRW